MSLAATNPHHRVSRRKSVNNSASSTAAAAIVAALREHGDASSIPVAVHRKSIGSKKAVETQSMNVRPSMHSYFSGGDDDNEDVDILGQDSSSDILDEGAIDEDVTSVKQLTIKNRNRRASEGSHLIRGGGKRVTSEVRCDTCGKGYKHSSCLTKHM